MRPHYLLDRLVVAVREPGRTLRFGIPLVLALLLVMYLAVLWPWMIGWGATADERARAMPGDELVPFATHQSTRAITVRAPAAVSWSWLVQIGQDRAGFYSYTWLENLFGADIHNAAAIRPEWQQLEMGDLVRAVPEGFLGGRLETPGWRVAALEPDRWFVLENWGLFLVEPVDDATSRVIVRTRFQDETWWGPAITYMAFGPVHFVMERQMLLGLRARAEGRRSQVLDALAGAGFVAGVIGVTLLFLWRKQARAWLALPTMLLTAVIIATGDPTAGAAGFIALGLVLLGLPQLRRRWQVLIAAAAVVLLVLLLAPNAHHAFGLLFLLTILGVLASRRTSELRAGPEGGLREQFVGMPPAGRAT